MNSALFNEILRQGESDTVDFKASGYFQGEETTKKDKNIDFLKDIISLANTMRNETAFIIIGIDDNRNLIGISEAELVDGSILQQKVKDKVTPVPKFNSYPFTNEDGLLFQIIEIPVTWYAGPCRPTVTSGNTLEKGEVYIRRDSSNVKATHDESVRLQNWLDQLPKNVHLNSKAKSTARENVGFKFDEVTIQKLFGNEAAEDEDVDRLREYYFKNDIFEKVAVDLPLRILVGHKGIGKSALFNVAMAEDKESGKLPVKIKPDDVSHLGKNLGDFSETIRNWRDGLLKIIYKKSLNYFGISTTTEIDLDHIEGNFVEFIIEQFDQAWEENNIPLKNQLLLQTFLENPIFNIYIDDLDRGWQGSQSDITKISSLLNAVRDIINNENRRIQFKISLRSDVYFLYRTSDESTDKTQSSVIWYRWSQHEILSLLVKRIRTYFDKDVDEDFLRTAHQGDLATNLNLIIEPIFSGQGKWESKQMYKVLLSVIRKRPRDMVKLLTLAARKAENRRAALISTRDLQAIFDEYSLDRIQDTVNEYKSELPTIERLIFGMKPDRKTIKTSESFYYDTSSLLSKINRIISRGEFRFAGGRLADAKDLAAFLYKINFITATKQMEDGFIQRKDFEENRYLAPKFEDFGYDWEVHMAFRWGLQPTGNDSMYITLL